MEDKQDWEIAYKSADKFDIELKQAKLKELGIESLIFDHQDSMYKMLNDTNYGIALYVHKKDISKAKAHLEN